MNSQIMLTFVLKLLVLPSQLKQEFDNNKYNQNITNIHLDDMFATGLKVFKEV